MLGVGVMPQMKFSLSDHDGEFVNHHEQWGFPDKSSLVREALVQLRSRLHHKRVAESAALYAELYRDDRELRKLTDHALEGWPE